MERTYDLSWVQGRKEKKTGKSTMPLNLRNLKPTSTFDPRRIWESEKEAEATSSAAAAGGGSSAAGGGGGQKKKKKPSKRDEILKANERKKEGEALDRDMEMLRNTLSRNRRALLTIKMITPFGRLNQLLEVLKEAVETKDEPLAFDCLWAIEDHPLYVKAVAEEAARRSADDTSASGASSSSSSKKKKKKSSSSSSSSKVQRSAEAALVHSFKSQIKDVSKKRAGRDMIAFQLTEMGDRLPPLSPFSTGFRLDDWQKRLLRIIDARQSAIVCAPTSSGKTVLSTYAATATGGRVLFVVPTEPLVWQVAAMFHDFLDGKVALCTNQFAYRPEGSVAQVVVGTPAALESHLSKVRGKVGAEAQNKLDFAQMHAGFDFEYAIFDEVHSLDGEEGAALQRIIRTVTCSVLALSATIGNAQQLLDWWCFAKGASPIRYAAGAEEAKGDGDGEGGGGGGGGHVSTAEVLVIPPTAEGEEGPAAGVPLASALQDMPPNSHIALEEHSGRFINLQRYVWDASSGGLLPLHPCAALSNVFLQEEDLSKASLAFTPRDAFALWEALRASFEEAEIGDLDPSTFFRRFNTPRVELLHTKAYEGALQQRLHALSRTQPERTAALLASFAPERVPQDVDIYSFATELKRRRLTPALVFQLNTFSCVQLFGELLHLLEEAQDREVPQWREELEQRQLKKRQEASAKAGMAAGLGRNQKEALEEQKAEGADLSGSGDVVDMEEPHPDFVLAPPNACVSGVEFDEICKDVREIKSRQHPWLRALRRGIGIYIDEAVFPTYRQAVQRLAQRGKLAVVFSDGSLAYGVNMPFRTTAFCGDMGELLTPLMGQQMSGRAGRRGLDTQGNLVYLNTPWGRIKELMLGRVPAIRGQEPRYPLQPLQRALAKHNGVLYEADPLDGNNFAWMSEEQEKGVCGVPFADFCDGAEGDPEAYWRTAVAACQELDLLDADGELNLDESRPHSLFALTWELRDCVGSALALVQCLPFFLRRFGPGRADGTHANISLAARERHAEQVARQVQLTFLLLQLFDRHPMDADLFPSAAAPLQRDRYVQKSQARAELQEELEELLLASQERIIGVADAERLGLEPPPGTDLDPSLFTVIKEGSLKSIPDLSPFAIHTLKGRLFTFGSRVITLHNCLSQNAPYDELEPLLRKVFVRVRYLLRDSIENMNLEQAPSMLSAAAPLLDDDGAEDGEDAAAEEDVVDAEALAADAAPAEAPSAEAHPAEAAAAEAPAADAPVAVGEEAGPAKVDKSVSFAEGTTAPAESASSGLMMAKKKPKKKKKPPLAMKG